MFILAVLIGLYSYLVFFLGVLGLLYRNIIFISTITFIAAAIILLRSSCVPSKILSSFKFFFSCTQRSKLNLFLFIILVLQIGFTLIGALGPELSFDALWYHLALPKIFILDHRIHHIPGNLLYYSDMPKLGEMLYIPSLMFGNEIIAKLIHFTFGILCLIALHRLSRKFLDQTLSLLVLVIFYQNLVVGWESITAYIDLIWTFFTIVTITEFINFIKDKKRKSLLRFAVAFGFSITAKLISGWMFLFFIIYFLLQRKIKSGAFFVLVSILIPLPYFIFSCLSTGNPFYPFFGHYSDWYVISPLQFAQNLWTIFTHADDPISPIYIIFLPLVIWCWRKLQKEIKLLFLFSVFGSLFLYFSPHGTWGRYMLPYLPALSVVIGAVLQKIEHKVFYKAFIVIIIFISITSTIYRGVANAKSIPVIVGKESKHEFLTYNLNFSFGDFYDTDGYFKSHIKYSDKVLLIGFHNLYYVDFPFVDASWYRKGDWFNYIAVQNEKLPSAFNDWHKVYLNSKSHVTLYTK